jgi:phosphatidate cytidylyltransferase
VFTFFLFGYFLKFPFNEYQLISFGLVIGIVGQFGDFLESSFKRDANVKDSSKLLSEHGGMLDRLDSIMFTAPAILILLTWFLM